VILSISGAGKIPVSSQRGIEVKECLIHRICGKGQEGQWNISVVTYGIVFALNPFDSLLSTLSLFLLRERSGWFQSRNFWSHLTVDYTNLYNVSDRTYDTENHTSFIGFIIFILSETQDNNLRVLATSLHRLSQWS
jgi:hypothetical protein